ncbi:hypothetical protein TNCV_313151 [Trichonephila clavipes]|nr:hypothetical protein TNCV_313151 [Trichonephila clavipes]
MSSSSEGTSVSYANTSLDPRSPCKIGLVIWKANKTGHDLFTAVQRLIRGVGRREFRYVDKPTRSPDLNPIENVWDALGRQVAGRNYPSTNKNTLIRALTEEWDKLPQQLLDNVGQSMVRRVERCITLHGGHIPY